MLAQAVEACAFGAARFIGPDDDVIAQRVRGEESVDATGVEMVALDDAIDPLERIAMELGRFGRAIGILRLEHLVLAIPHTAQFPRMKEWSPVDVIDEVAQGHFECPCASEGRRRRSVVVPIVFRRGGAGLLECEGFFFWPADEIFAQRFLFREVVADEAVALVGGEQRGGDGYRARGVEHMHDRAGVMLGDLDGRVCSGGGRATNEQRDFESAAFHFLGDMHHLVERWSDQAREADDIRADLDGLVQNFVAVDHHAKVGDLEAVAREHDADDVFADVVHIAFYCGDEETAG